jgi:hypothetical protein
MGVMLRWKKDLKRVQGKECGKRRIEEAQDKIQENSGNEG